MKRLKLIGEMMECYMTIRRLVSSYCPQYRVEHLDQVMREDLQILLTDCALNDPDHEVAFCEPQTMGDDNIYPWISNTAMLITKKQELFHHNSAEVNK